MTTAEKIKVMQAFVDGKSIECKSKSGVWAPSGNTIHSGNTWNWSEYDYRVKAEPTLQSRNAYEKDIRDLEQENAKLKKKWQELKSGIKATMKANEETNWARNSGKTFNRVLESVLNRMQELEAGE